MNPTTAVVINLLRLGVRQADCSRRRVSAVLVHSGIIVGVGHNRLPSGSCLAGDCPRGKMSYEEQPADMGYEESGCVSIHAEDMALSRAGARAVGAIAYVSEWPCPRCEERLKVAGVTGFVKVDLSESASDSNRPSALLRPPPGA